MATSLPFAGNVNFRNDVVKNPHSLLPFKRVEFIYPKRRWDTSRTQLHIYLHKTKNDSDFHKFRNVGIYKTITTCSNTLLHLCWQSVYWNEWNFIYSAFPSARRTLVSAISVGLFYHLTKAAVSLILQTFGWNTGNHISCVVIISENETDRMKTLSSL
jgi:hypothetical protein